MLILPSKTNYSSSISVRKSTLARKALVGITSTSHRVTSSEVEFFRSKKKNVDKQNIQLNKTAVYALKQYYFAQ